MSRRQLRHLPRRAGGVRRPLASRRPPRRAGRRPVRGRDRADRAADGAVTQDGCIRARHNPEGLAGAQAGLRRRGHGHRRQLVAADRRRRGGARLQRGVRRRARAAAAGAHRGVAVSGCAPEIMGIGPVASTRKALQRAGITVDDLDVVELNEAFAGQALACAASSASTDDTLNIDGGAIALGHPLGATGARIVGKAAALLEARGRALRARHPVHRRRPGHRHRAGGGLMAERSDKVGASSAPASWAPASPRTSPMPACRCVLLDIVPEARPTATRSPRARSRSC